MKITKIGHFTPETSQNTVILTVYSLHRVNKLILENNLKMNSKKEKL